MVDRIAQVKLTESDREILNSYIPVIDGLADYLGENFEFVLHSLEDFEHSVIAIKNGEHTGRTVGSPITDLALKRLDSLSKGTPVEPYFSTNKSGEPLKCATIPIHGTSGAIVGLICINMYLNAPLSSYIDSLAELPRGAGLGRGVKENFASSASELIASSLTEVREQVNADPSVLPSLRNKRIVEELCERGIFRLKDAVGTVAELLGISKNTVYMHIRNRRNGSC